MEAKQQLLGSSFIDLLSQLDSLRQKVDCLSLSRSAVSFHTPGAGCIVNSKMRGLILRHAFH